MKVAHAWLVIALLAGASSAGAQTFCIAATGAPGTPSNCPNPATNTIATLVLGTVGRLLVPNPFSTNIMSGATVTIADYVASEGVGVGPEFLGPQLHVSANKAYNVTVQSPATFNVSPNSKPASEVSYSVNGVMGVCGGTYTAFTGATQPIGSGAGATALTRFQVCFRVKWLWASDPEGAYTLGLTFTLNAP